MKDVEGKSKEEREEKNGEWERIKKKERKKEN